MKELFVFVDNEVCYPDILGDDSFDQVTLQRGTVFIQYSKYKAIAQHRGKGVFGLAVGTLCYRRTYGLEALRILIKEIQQGRLIDRSELTGQFCLLIEYNGDIILTSDSNSVYQIYTTKDKEVITNSFEIALHFQRNTISEMAVLSNIVAGYVPYPFTISDQVRRVERECLFQTDNYINRGVDDSRVVFRDRKEALDCQLENLRSLFDNWSSLFEKEGVVVGVSGGYDSRLLALLLNGKATDVYAFTHHKKNDPDPKVAKKFMSILGHSVNEIATAPVWDLDGKDLQKNLESAGDLFDLRVISMMNYLKREYTKEYRDHNWQLNFCITGVGGEIFRNHWHISAPTSSWHWSKNFLIGSKWKSILKDSARINGLNEYLISASPCLSGTKKMNYQTAQDFYGREWLPDWHGVRNTGENHFRYHLSPFTEDSVIRHALSANRYTKSNRFQADMISRLHPEAAAVESVYGYPFSKPKTKKDRIRKSIPVPLRSQLNDFRYKSKNKSRDENEPAAWLESNSINKYFYKIKPYLGEINQNLLMQDSEALLLSLSVGYIIERIEEINQKCSSELVFK